MHQINMVHLLRYIPRIAILAFLPHYHSFCVNVNTRNGCRSELQSTNINDHEHDELLKKMIRFYGEDMVDSTTKRFYYYCRPFDGECVHDHMPIRDLAAAWDATKAIAFLDDIDDEMSSSIRQTLKDAVKCTLAHYLNSLDNIQQGSGVSLSEDILFEPSNIGHSALLLLGTCNALELNIFEENQTNEVKDAIDGLVRGILSVQLDNGAFCSCFRNNEDFLQGIAFFPGEAMLALSTAYEYNILNTATHQLILPAMQKAFRFYSDYHKTADVDVNYNIWQVIAFSKLFGCLEAEPEKQREVASYVLGMCQEICQSKSWKYQLSRGKSFYVNLQTIEIACSLDALSVGICVAILQREDELAKLLTVHAKNAVYFLSWIQSQVPAGCVVGCGGLGFGGTCVLEQRLDVTGHAISALVKLRKVLD